MKKSVNKILAIITVCLIMSPVLAEQISLEMAKKNISKQFGNVSIENISPSPVPGLYQVAMPPRFFLCKCRWSLCC